jgi:DNA polymerase I-like protein with 3'-5' exonuclease and polymerase domains
LIALDTETTGLDLWHGCRPFYVSTVDDAGTIRCWEWDVDPLTRTPAIPKKDIAEITKLIQAHTKPKIKNRGIVFHNAKFDLRALDLIGVTLPPWDCVHDTCIASHALSSQSSHKLKDLAQIHLGIPTDDESDLREAVQAARRYGRKHGWRVAKANDPHWPAMKNTPKGKTGGDSWWACDMWMPRAVAKAEWKQANDPGSEWSPPGFRCPGEHAPDENPPGHLWWTVCAKYGTTDAERTILLWKLFKDGLESEGLWDQYEARRRMVKITYKIETRGIYTTEQRIADAAVEYVADAEQTRKVCLSLADHKIDNLKSPKQLQAVLFAEWQVPVERRTQTGYSTKKEDLEATLPLLNSRSPEYHFIKNLLRNRKLLKAVDYLEGYKLSGLHATEHAALPKPHRDTAFDRRATRRADARAVLSAWLRIHPNFNITGTDTTRFSSNNPNAQNISKQEGFNLRRVFGPPPGREWFAIDYENIEMRIPAFTYGEQSLIKLFADGGSYHLLVGSILWPDLFKKLGSDGFKKTEQYRWVKNGNFAMQYGGQRPKVDKTFKVTGAYDRLRNSFPKIAAANDFHVAHANEHGYVICKGGYRLECPEGYRGGVKPTTPFNYFTQGTAGWAMIKAMDRVDQYLEKLNGEIDRKAPTFKAPGNPEPWSKKEPRQSVADPYYYMVMTIHDELDFDFPIHPRNPSVIKECKRLMELSSQDIDVPLIASVKWIPNNWSEEKDLKEWKAAA